MVSKKAKVWKKRLPELVKKGMIDPEQEKTLAQMIDSPDKDNFTVVHTLIKNFIRDKLSEGLNEGQKNAFHKMIGFLEFPEHDATVLKGYAGTGKTFLIKRVIEYITQTETTSNIAITAPTNKAVAVAFKNSALNDKNLNAYVFEDLFNASSRLTYSTIHKLLNLKEVIMPDGKQLFEPDKKNPSDIRNFKYLIVDETSMLDDQLCKDLMRQSSRLRIIFMGDPCQIPPVRHTNSLPFRDDHTFNFLVLELTEIMRQKSDNPIIAASFDIRDKLRDPVPIPTIKTDLNERGHGIVYLDGAAPDRKGQVMSLLKTYFDSEEFVKDSDYMRIIAWKNKTVNYMNNMVRELLYGKDIPTYVEGERLIVQKPIFKKGDKYWKILFTTSEELEVVHSEVVPFRHFEGMFNLAGEQYALDVSSYDVLKDRYVEETINVVHESTIQAYQDLLKKAREKAIKSCNVMDWVIYYNIIKWFANVGYGYAITAHKSQGSTYKNVLVLEDDIDENFNVVERNRIKYTAYSRASELLHILRRNKT